MDEVASFATDSEIDSALARLFPRGRRVAPITVGFASESQLLVGSTLAGCASRCDLPVPLGCTIKLLTAAMLREELAARGIALSEPIVSVFARRADRIALRDVSFRDLLEHTHGLDGSQLLARPLRPDGFTHLEKLWQGIAPTRIALPGLLYSYGDLGGWLAAAALEQMCERNFAHLLWELFERHEIAPSMAFDAGSVCPSTGGTIALRISDLLRLLGRLSRDAGLERARGAQQSGAAPRIVSLPGWSAAERGVCLAWKYYGAGWFGHNSLTSAEQVCIRQHPIKRITIVVATNGYSATAVASRLFRDLLMEAAGTRLPRLVSPELAAVTSKRCIGNYGTRRTCVTVAMSPEGVLRLSAIDRHTGYCDAAALIAAEHGIFLLEPMSEHFPFVQFIEGDCGTLDYLWNGRALWPRCTTDRQEVAQRAIASS